jgi:preprotein translocase subunit SecE
MLIFLAARTSQTKMANKITQFFKEAKVELYKVNWPSKNQLINYTLMVIGVSVAVAVFLGTLDYFFGFTIKTFIIK